MANTQNLEPDSTDDVAPVVGNDPTNGLAGDVDGDDGGAETSDAGNCTLIGGMIDHAFDVPDDETHDTGDGDEGRP